MAIIYRQAKKADIPELVEMRWDMQLVGREEYVATKDEFMRVCADFLKEQFALKNSWHFVAEINQEIIACATLIIVSNLPKPGALKNNWGYLTNVYTKPQYRRQGIGTVLVKQAINWADENGLDKVVLWPRPAGLNIYKQLGFDQNTEVMERKKGI